MVLCKECGLTSDDLETMTVGMALDYITEYLNMKEPKGKKQGSTVREATQADFDKF